MTTIEIKDYLTKLYCDTNNTGVKAEDVKLYDHGCFTKYLRQLLENKNAEISFIDDINFPLIYNGDSVQISEDKCNYIALNCDNDLEFEKEPEKGKTFNDVMEGLFCITLDGYVYYGAKGKDIGPSDFLITVTDNDIDYILNKYITIKDVVNLPILPTKGIYRAVTKKSMMGSYLDLEAIEDTNNGITVYHTGKEALEKDLNFYMNNIKIFSRFNQKPLRKYLLHGEPGTGKTSICIEIAKAYASDALVVFTTDFETVKKVLNHAAESNIKTIVVFEDCDMSFYRTGSDVLNFLDGIDCPNVEKGAAILMTSNHPERIEERILKRPGRIDKIFHIGSLSSVEDIYNVFCLYFKEIMDNCNFDYKDKNSRKAIEILASEMTGAQIKELANSYICYMVAEQKEFNLYDIWECRRKMFDAFKVSLKGNSLEFDYSKKETNLLKLLK